MNTIKIDTTKLKQIPSYATKGSAGLDISANITEPITIQPAEMRMIPTGVYCTLPEQTFGLLASRSGLSTKHGITLINGIGVIDSDYRGEIKCPLMNLSNVPYTIQPGERIAQLIVTPYMSCNIQLVQELTNTDRGVGGFGSTGK